MTKLSKEVFDETKWKDIDHEIYRTYVFGNMGKVRIDKPVLLYISKSGGHRILDAKDISHYIPPYWTHLYWETDDDNAFRF